MTILKMQCLKNGRKTKQIWRTQYLKIEGEEATDLKIGETLKSIPLKKQYEYEDHSTMESEVYFDY
jgi:hypothetical protein